MVAAMSEEQPMYAAGPEPERYCLCDDTMVIVVGSRWYIQRYDGNHMMPEEAVAELVQVWLERHENGQATESPADH